MQTQAFGPPVGGHCNQPRLIAFDLDGTIIDTMGSFADIAGELLQEAYGWSFEQGRARYLETCGVPFFQQLEIMLPGNRHNARVAQQFEKRKLSAFIREKIAEPTLETLHKLKDREIFTAISSNNFDTLVKEFVHRENVPVDLALGFKILPNGEYFCKGAPHFRHLQQRFNIPARSMVFVGDSLKDASLAEENEIRFIAKIGTFSEADFRAQYNSHLTGAVYEIHELLDLLEA